MTKDSLLETAQLAGFDLCRIAKAGPAPHARELQAWLESGHHATMDWMQRTAEQRSDPRVLLPGALSVVVLATNYYRSSAQGDPGREGRIARYARGPDYHDVIGPRLHSLDRAMSAAGGVQKCFVDGGPVLERDWAAASGVSWHGKSTMGIHPELGTWFFLSVILTTLEFEPDAPIADRCGRCTRCIDACPTDAIVAPHRLDARRCISFLTIENKGPIPEEFREAMGDRIFGCDDCLDACPWNRFARESRDAQLSPLPRIQGTRLRDFLSLDNSAFKALFAGSPILRAKRRGFLRNVCVALGNKGTAEDLPALRAAVADHEQLVRDHAAWAIARIESREERSHQPRCSIESR